MVRAFTDAKRRAKWLPAADAELARGSDGGAEAKSSKGFVIRPDGLGRYRYKWGTTTVQFYLIPKGAGRTSVVVTHLKLESAAALEERRQQWRAALDGLARLFIED